MDLSVDVCMYVLVFVMGWDEDEIESNASNVSIYETRQK